MAASVLARAMRCRTGVWVLWNCRQQFGRNVINSDTWHVGRWRADFYGWIIVSAFGCLIMRSQIWICLLLDMCYARAAIDSCLTAITSRIHCSNKNARYYVMDINQSSSSIYIIIINIYIIHGESTWKLRTQIECHCMLSLNIYLWNRMEMYCVISTIYIFKLNDFVFQWICIVLSFGNFGYEN